MKNQWIKENNLVFLFTYKLTSMQSAIHNNQEINIDFEPDSGYMFGRKNGKKIFILEFRHCGDKMNLTFLRVFQENKGFGSYALQEFEKWVKSLNLTEIYGELVEGPDCDEPAKLKYFYSKNDYTIIDKTGSDSSYAEISKKI